MLPTPLVLRLARRLHAAWAGRPPPPDPGGAWSALDARVARLGRLRRLLGLAAGKGWTLAAARVAADLAAGLDDLARHAALLRAGSAPPPAPPGEGDFARDLRQLEDEFGDVEVRWRDGVLRAATDPIALGSIDLGPFAIEFHWDRVGHERAARCFAVIALDPNPAAG